MVHIIATGNGMVNNITSSEGRRALVTRTEALLPLNVSIQFVSRITNLSQLCCRDPRN